MKKKLKIILNLSVFETEVLITEFSAWLEGIDGDDELGIQRIKSLEYLIQRFNKNLNK